MKPTSTRAVVPPSIPLKISGASLRDRINTPYNWEVFKNALEEYSLLHLYPDLPNKLRFGFSIGDFSPLAHTSCPPNHASGTQNLDFIKSYAEEQVVLGRMSGPYTQDQVEGILNSPFVSSPLAVVEKTGGAGLRLIQNCSYVNDQGISVNMFINSDAFPTRWGTAAKFAQRVSAQSVLFSHFSANLARD